MNDQVEESKAKAAGIVGILIGVIALIELICGFIYLSTAVPDRYGSGLWSGVGLGVIAVLGIVTWVKKNKRALVFYLVMCFLWFIVSIVQVVVAYIAYVIYHDTVTLLENCDHIEYIRDVCVCYDTGDTRITAIVHFCDDVKPIESIFLCILIVSVLAAILTLRGSIIGCKGTCCNGSAPRNVVVMQQTLMTQQEFPAQPSLSGTADIPGTAARFLNRSNQQVFKSVSLLRRLPLDSSCDLLRLRDEPLGMLR